MLKACFAKLSEKEVMEIASEEGTRAIRNLALLTARLDLDSFLEDFVYWIQVNNFVYNYTREEDHRFVIYHGLGKNFSLFAFTTISNIVEELDGNAEKLDLSEDTFSFSISS